MESKIPVFAAILAGGSGTRLWPLSRQTLPKQLLALTGDNTLLQETCRRILPVIPAKNQMILTSPDYSQQVSTQMTSFFQEDSPKVFAEPKAKNTAPAIFWAAKLALKWGGEKAIIVVLPSDHLIVKEENFQKQLLEAIELASLGYFATFGILPTHPETGYGYIEAGEKINGTEGFRVKKFFEKPNLQKAKEFCSNKTFTWNSGMFAFPASDLLKEGVKYCPETTKPFIDIDPTVAETVKTAFDSCRSISIDYAVMEKTSQGCVIQAEFGWSDVGSWQSLFQVSNKDTAGNVIVGDHVAIDTKDSLIFGKHRTIATIGIKDLAIVDTPDALLVCPMSESQKVKEVVEKLKIDKRREIHEHVTIHRPWGSYTTLETGSRYKIKRIVVQPGKRLSLQRHMHRSEHWVVVSGTATIRNGDEEFYLNENESTYIRPTELHRLSNYGKIPLQIIEIQVGGYLEEDDIERFDDDFNRGTKVIAKEG
ncbi:MAG: mannose-1-phosphate guanylyltransferase/mannose-6-phosphate isomerase [Candidatus Riflebacteria bacterium]|nr:mannose-1-phosphate guanylyltransferase/mannose-6-phosphate isomerase [Candidatus Riflebacteria bacterium]